MHLRSRACVREPAIHRISPAGTAESSPGRSPGYHAHNDEKSRKGRLKVNQVVLQDCILGNFQPSLRD